MENCVHSGKMTAAMCERMCTVVHPCVRMRAYVHVYGRTTKGNSKVRERANEKDNASICER